MAVQGTGHLDLELVEVLDEAELHLIGVKLNSTLEQKRLVGAQVKKSSRLCSSSRKVAFYADWGNLEEDQTRSSYEARCRRRSSSRCCCCLCLFVVVVADSELDEVGT